MVSVINKQMSVLKKNIPNLFEHPEECCGCSACFSICSSEAISMIEDAEGFEYPSINPKKCVCCGMCLKVCPI